MRRAHLVLLVVVLLAVAAPLALAQSEGGSKGDDDHPGPDSPAAAQDQFTIEELSDSGTIRDERFPSLRVKGEMTAFWLNRYPPTGFNEFGNGTNQAVTPDSVIKRNRIEMVATHPWDGEVREYNLTLVYWHPDTKEVQTENGTTEERFANVTGVGHQVLTFPSGMQRSETIHLRGHYDRATYVTMFLHFPDGETHQWLFKLKSIATAQPVNIDSRGELYKWALLWLIGPAVVLSWFTARKTRQFREAADAGPGYSAGALISLGILLFGLVFMAAYSAFATLVAALPVVFAFFVAFVLWAILVTEDTGRVETWGFIRLDPQKTTSPIDFDAEVLDSSEVDVKSYDVVFDEDGRPALYHKGFRAMYARARNCYAYLTVLNQQARFEGTGDYDQLFVVEEGDGPLVEHEAERVIFKFPWRTYSPPTDKNGDVREDHPDWDPELASVLPREMGKAQWVQLLGMVAVPALLGAASWKFLGAWFWGPMACLPLVWRFAHPIDGGATAKVAPGQARAAFTTAWYADITLKRFKSIDELAKRYVQANQRQKDITEWIDHLDDEGLIENAHDRESSPFSLELTEEDPAVLDRESRQEADD